MFQQSGLHLLARQDRATWLFFAEIEHETGYMI